MSNASGGAKPAAPAPTAAHKKKGGIGAACAEVGRAFTQGDILTRLSFLVMGLGCAARKQIAKGVIFLACELWFIWYIGSYGVYYLSRVGTLGTSALTRTWDEARQIYINTPGDDSMHILLFSVVSIFIILVFALVYFANVRAAAHAQREVEAGRRPPSMRQEVAALFDKNLHVTLMSLPTVGVMAFTVLPLVFMILIAFTNFDRQHQPPGNLFTWVGLQNFFDVFWRNKEKSATFVGLLGWTMIWAVMATFMCYILGMIVAMLINKKGIKLKGLWRFCFVLSIAVPAFVTLLIMRILLNEQGAINVLLQNVLGVTSSAVPFLTNVTMARISVILVNLWIGIPFTILIVSGILMNIPEDLYEAARIDGAGPVRQFVSITLPYMLFVTTPYLITQFIGNINNFNAIYFLTAGGPLSLDYYQAGKTDLLVTWLYKLTVTSQDYSLASAIGILVFVVCAIVSLITFNITASSKKEESFS